MIHAELFDEAEKLLDEEATLATAGPIRAPPCMTDSELAATNPLALVAAS